VPGTPQTLERAGQVSLATGGILLIATGVGAGAGVYSMSSTALSSTARIGGTVGRKLINALAH
jgi:hypothetical protein